MEVVLALRVTIELLEQSKLLSTMTSLGYYSSTTEKDAGDHVRKNTKNISFGVVRRCSFEHYTCHRNLGKLRKN